MAVFFEAFIELTYNVPSSNHSVICRFRECTGKETLDKVQYELLHQFDALDSSIESGVAIDARVVKSATRSFSDRKLKLI